MRKLALIFICFMVIDVSAQEALNNYSVVVGRLDEGLMMPAHILDGRSVVVYSSDLTRQEVIDTHNGLRNVGIDAVAYFDSDRIFAGRSITERFADYFVRREVSNLIFLSRDDDYQVLITSFNGRPSLVDPNQSAWGGHHAELKELLLDVYRAAADASQLNNRLINDVPEVNLPVTIITGNRIEAYAYDLKVDPIAIPRFNDSLADQRLAELFQSYPFKYELVDPTIDEKELRKKGFFYILEFVHARGTVARDLLGYAPNPSETAYASVAFPGGEMQLRNIPARETVYKFYVKMIDSGNVYLGTKWDADLTWYQALKNYILGMKWELRIE